MRAVHCVFLVLRILFWGVGSVNVSGWPAGWPGVALVHRIFSGHVAGGGCFALKNASGGLLFGVQVAALALSGGGASCIWLVPRIKKCVGLARGPACGRARLLSGGPGLFKTGRCIMFIWSWCIAFE